MDLFGEDTTRYEGLPFSPLPSLYLSQSSYQPWWRGLTNHQIASELSISEHTAANHIAKILKELGLQSRAQIGSWLAEQRTSPFTPD